MAGVVAIRPCHVRAARQGELRVAGGTHGTGAVLARGVPCHRQCRRTESGRRSSAFGACTCPHRSSQRGPEAKARSSAQREHMHGAWRESRDGETNRGERVLALEGFGEEQPLRAWVVRNRVVLSTRSTRATQRVRANAVTRNTRRAHMTPALRHATPGVPWRPPTQVHREAAVRARWGTYTG